MTMLRCDQIKLESRGRLDADPTSSLRVRCKIWLENDEGMPIIGEGRLRILQAIRRTGSISKASKALKQPFRNVWAKIKDAERQCGFKLVETAKSGSKLTAEGERLMFKYAELARSCNRSANEKFRRLFSSQH